MYSLEVERNGHGKWNCPFCGAELSDDPRRICHECRTSDRNRCLLVLYEALRSLLLPLNCLNLTADRVALDRGFFDQITISVYGGENHIDVQKIDLPDDSFDFTICNHVLEHVQDDHSSIRELVRVSRVAVQISVPVTSMVFRGTEYGSADPLRQGHFRHYGADFGTVVKRLVPYCVVMVTVQIDEPSGNYDTSYLVVKDIAFAEKAFIHLRKCGIPCVVI